MSKMDIKDKKVWLPLLLIVVGLLMSFHSPLLEMISPAKVDLQIQHQPIIMPAVYKVYANDNAMEGKYALFKMLVTNSSNSTARNVEVSFQIPNFIEWKTITTIPMILPNQSVVVNCYPEFTDKIVDKTTSSKEQVNIKVKGRNLDEVDQNFEIDIKGRNEFMYTCLPADEIRTASEAFDNMSLLSCFVTPEDPIIKYYTQQVQEKVLKGEEASVGNKEKEGVRFLEGVYYATLISHMVYSGTSGVPAKFDDVSSLIQSIRLPREVLTGKTGLCIELSIMYASILMDAGLDPIIYLIPGHAYPGFKMNGNYYAIESTGIGGEGLGGRMTVDQAYQTGMKNLNEFFQKASAGDDRYRLVDVRDCISKGAVAMELKDDPYLRQKVDEIAQSFGGNGGQSNIPQQQNQQSQQQNDVATDQGGDANGGNDAGNTGGAPAGYNLFQGVVTFAYPNSWKLANRTAQTMPQVKHILVNSSYNAYVEVYDFPGYSSTGQAIAAIQQYVSQNARVQYKAAGQEDNGYMLYNGQTFYNNGGLNWIAAFKQTGNGVSGIAVGTAFNTGSKYQSTIIKIINSLK